MKIGIIGAGAVGTTLAQAFAQNGHQVMLSFSRNPEKLKELAAQLGVQVGTPAQATDFGDILVFAPRFEHIADASLQMGSVVGKVVIDANNAFNPERNGLVDLKGETALDKVAQVLPGAIIVKAFNSLSVEQFVSERGKGKVLFIAGDHTDAKATVGLLIKEIGFEPVDAGNAKNAVLTEVPGPLFMKVMSRTEAETQVGELI